jgi:hypothetical protein
VVVGVTSREEHSFRMFENMRLRKIFAPEWERVMGRLETNCVMRSVYPSIQSSIHGSTALC